MKQLLEIFIIGDSSAQSLNTYFEILLGGHRTRLDLNLDTLLMINLARSSFLIPKKLNKRIDLNTTKYNQLKCNQ